VGYVSGSTTMPYLQVAATGKPLVDVERLAREYEEVVVAGRWWRMLPVLGLALAAGGVTWLHAVHLSVLVDWRVCVTSAAALLWRAIRARGCACAAVLPQAPRCKRLLREQLRWT
jgi:hypothetical protein